MFELKRIGFVKRVSAWFLDAILLAVLATGFLFVISLICGFDAQQALATEYYTQWEDFRKEYIGELAGHYGYVYEQTEEGDRLSKDGQTAAIDDLLKELVASEGKDEAVSEAYEAYKALPPVEKVNRQYEYVYTMLFMMVSLGIFLSYFVLEFVVPLFLKNGQTVGKKVFAVCLVRPNCVKITNLSLFARTMLGKFSVETMFPVLLVFLFFFGGLGLLAIILFAALLLLNAVLFFATKNKTPIHDILAGTVAVDAKLQMIYATEEEFAQRKALAQREEAEREKDE